MTQICTSAYELNVCVDQYISESVSYKLVQRFSELHEFPELLAGAGAAVRGCRPGQHGNLAALARAAAQGGSFSSGLHTRQGVASRVSSTNEVSFIDNEVLGGWNLLKLWQRERLVREGEADSSV